mmetsp:Transcript_91578/g.255869  ORF Transcript_91578/g.255869 Transcript_91578/m.255869 type:complete len:200 (+) Transcript_91578:2482-3081(+)
MALNSSNEILPSSSASSCLAMASRRASPKAISSLPMASDCFASQAAKPCEDNGAGPPAASLKRSSCVRHFSLMRSRKAVAKVRRDCPTRKRSPASSPINGAAASVAFFTSSSIAASLASASAIAVFAVYFASYAPATFLCLVMAVWVSCTRVFSSARASVWASFPFASRCLPERKRFVDSMAVCAAFNCTTNLSVASSG